MAECPRCGASVQVEALVCKIMQEVHEVPYCGTCGCAWPAAFLAQVLSPGALSMIRTARRDAVLQLADAARPALLAALPSWRTGKDLYAERDSLIREHGAGQLVRDDLRRQRQAVRAEAARVAGAVHATAGQTIAESGAAVGAAVGTVAGTAVGAAIGAAVGAAVGAVMNSAACARRGCDGMLVNGECVACFTLACAECGEVTDRHSAHVCDLAAVLSRRVIAQGTRPCPRCAAPISRIEGCAQMFCTRCNTKFQWTTGLVIGESAFFDNPHFYAMRQAASRSRDSGRRCWCETLEAVRDRLGSSRAARVLLFLAVRQGMHLAELLGPALAPAWQSPFYFANGRDSYLMRQPLTVAERGGHSYWVNVDLDYGDQPGAVTCRGKTRARDSLARERERFAAGQLTEALFKRHLEQNERRWWDYARTTQVLAEHVAKLDDIVSAWFDDDETERVYARAFDFENVDADAAMEAAASADGVMLRALGDAAEKTWLALARLHLRPPATVDDVPLDPHVVSTCTDSASCQRHRYLPRRWLLRVKQTCDQVRATLEKADLAAEPRGGAAVICFFGACERALATGPRPRAGRGKDGKNPGSAAASTLSDLIASSPGARGLALLLPSSGAGCSCPHCTAARTFDEMRRDAPPEDRDEIELAEIEEHGELEARRVPWTCYARERELAHQAHSVLFP